MLYFNFVFSAEANEVVAVVRFLKEREAPSEVQIQQVTVFVGEKLDADL